MDTPTEEQIRQAVYEAVAEARERTGYGDRLVPFTAAEIRFIQDVVFGTLARVITEGSGDTDQA